jgi:hypothetical protein
MSERAKAVAKEILENIVNGSSLNQGEIAMRNGYSEKTANHNFKEIKETKAYQSVMEPVLKQLERERQRVITAMTTKVLDDVQYEKLSDVMDKLTKNIQLLSGGDTERTKVLVMPAELIDKYKLDDNANESTIRDSEGQTQI